MNTATKDEELRCVINDLCQEVRDRDAEIDMLRSALVGLIGTDDEQELLAIEATMRLLPAPDADKAVSINAIHALLKTANKH